MEKREETRDRKAMRVAIEADQRTIYGNTENVSPHGMRIVLHNKRVINPGKHVSVKVSKVGKHYQLSGEVRWFRFEILKNIMGLQFEEINDEFCTEILGVAPLGSQEHPYQKAFPDSVALENEYQSNLKFGGLFVPYKGQPPPLNQNVWVEMKLADQSFAANARVVIHQEGGFGVMFTDLGVIEKQIGELIH